MREPPAMPRSPSSSSSYPPLQNGTLAFPGTPDAPAARVLECIAVSEETPGIKTFVFRDRDPAGPRRFVAGQAVMLSMEVNGERCDRTFSIASSPALRGALSLTVKAQDTGRATRWMHDALQPGMRLNAFYPIGRFHLNAIPDMPLAFVSAGSGASPLMSMLRTLALYQPLADVAWVHSARDAHDILFAVELTALQRRMPNLRVMVTLSRPSPGWFGLCGRLTRRLIGAVVPDFNERDVYCCGPAGFMDEVRRIHAAEGARRAAFHVEHFAAPLPVLEPLPASASGPLTNAPTGVSDSGFQARLGRKTFTIAPGETILMAAARQQVVIPCGCASGMCGTCKLKCVSGDVVMRHQGGLSDADEANGFILACSSRPASDLDLEF